MGGTRAWVIAVALIAVACGGPPPAPDAGDDGGATCASAVDCDDGLFCNGEEECAPRAAGANARGCVSLGPACVAPLTCNESADRCDDSCPDGDGDGHGPSACGGDDCDDADADRFPGNVEICDPDGHDEDCDAETVGSRDADGDGFHSDRCCNGAGCASDCDDTRRGTNPSVPEVCDGLDNDCDGATDEGLLVELFRDADHDGVGIRPATELACPGQPGFAAAAGDCDDASAAVRPTAAEICDEVDNDCDGIVDEATLSVPWYVDADGDGFGVITAELPSIESCVPPAGRAIRIGDCDDGDAMIAPTARERCNAIDDDCDGRPDFQIAARDFEDDDGDGTPDAACAAASADCDDRDATVSSESAEICDGFDNDCDGVIDDGTSDQPWYADMDGDGYGDPTAAISSCELVPGRVLDATDCDDGNASTNPGAADACGGQVGVDDDCDGTVDEGGNALEFYADLDGDGWGTGEAIIACQSDARSATRRGDCDDAEARVNPDALDDCAAIAGVDDDCDGRVDETLTPRVFYVDVDGDGYGAGAPSEGCVQPAGTATANGDCDDASAIRNPGVPDDCATQLGVDDDCDASIDEAVVLLSFYVDLDGDGYGAGPATQACTAPAGMVATAGDCDDAAASRNPSAPDDCSRAPLVDDDCDGLVDEDAVLTDWRRDTDGDGYGSGAVTTACLAPTGYVAPGGDCDESRVAVHPGALDDCTGLASIDDDCDGAVDDDVVWTSFYPDADRDGYGTGTPVTACTAPAGHAALGGDCDDGTATRSPGRADDCTTTLGVDDDCDGMIDEGASPATYYRDADADGFGDLAIPTSACSAPAGFVANSTDCNDASATARPGGTELCSDLLDNDCDGAFDCSDTECSAGCPEINILSGGGQSAIIHSLFPMPLRVRVADRIGMPLAGRSVTLSTLGVSTGGSLTSTTDLMGEVSFPIRAGLAVGTETITVSSPGALPVTAALTGTAPAPRTIFTVMNAVRGTGYGGVPGPAYDARAGSNLGGVATTPDGTIYWASHYHIIRIEPSGRTTSVAGGGATFATDGLAASALRIDTAGLAIAADPARGRVYFGSACRLFYVDLATSTIRHFAGTGTCGLSGDGGPAIDAEMYSVVDLAVSDTGVVYLTGLGGPPRPVRAIDTSGIIRSLISDGAESGGYGVFTYSYQLAPIPGTTDLYVYTSCTHSSWALGRDCVIRVRADGSFTFVVGGGTDRTGEGIAATLAQIDGGHIAATADGALWIAETNPDRIRRVAGGIVTTIAGTLDTAGDTGDQGPAASALVSAPRWIRVFHGDHVVFSDSGNRALRAIW